MTQTRAGAGRWVILALVFCAVMLNYVDRQILALLKPTLEAKFAWSDQDYGNMASAFQFAAAVAFLGTGWLIDRVGLRIGFALGVAMWSLAGMAHAFAGTVTEFVGARVLSDSTLGGGNPGVLAVTVLLGALSALASGGLFGAAFVRFGSRGPVVLAIAVAALAVLVLLVLLPQIIAAAAAFEAWWLVVAALVVVAVGTAGEYLLLRRANVR